MDDLELLLLQSELLAVQERDVAVRLSERACVELILKLVSEHRVQLIFSSSGKEFVTPEKLEHELRELVELHSGKLSLIDVPELLGIDLHHIEGSAERLVQSSDGDLTLLNGALLHRSFVDAAVQEVWEAVEQSGKRDLADMAQQVALPLHFLREAIEARPMAGVLQAQTLYTNSFVEIERAMARAVLYALTQPTVLRSLCTDHNLQEDLFFDELLRLTTEDALPGSVIGTGTSALYQPDIFLRVQSASVNSFFEQNEFVSVERLRSVGISRPDEHMSKHFPTALKLDSVFVSATFHSTAMSAAEDASSERSWADCSMVCPSPLADADLSTLLRLCVQAVNKATNDADAKVIAVADTFAVSNAFRLKFIEDAKPAITALAKAAAVQYRATRKAAAAAVPVPEPEPEKLKAAKGKKGKKPKRTQEEPESDPDDWNMHKGKGKSKGKKNAAKRSKKRSARHDQDDEDVGAAGTGAPAKATLDVDMVLPEMEAMYVDCPPALLRALARLAAPVWSKHFCRERDSIFFESDSSKSKKKQHRAMAGRATELFEHISVFYHAIELVESDEGRGAIEDLADKEHSEFVAALHKHLLKSLCSSLADLLLHNQDFHYSDAFPQEEVHDATASLSHDQRRSILNRLPSRIGAQMQALFALLSNSSASPFISKVTSIAEECEIPLASLSRKREKNLLFSMRRALQQQIEAETNPHTLLLLVALVLHSQAFGVLLHAPSRVVGVIIALLKQRLTPVAFELLRAFHSRSNVLLPGQAAAQQHASDEKDDVESVSQEEIGALRSLGLSPKSAQRDVVEPPEII